MKSRYNGHYIRDCTNVDYELVEGKTIIILDAIKILTKINNGSDKNVVDNKKG